jgi:hypothetical protein
MILNLVVTHRTACLLEDVPKLFSMP